MRKDFIPKTVEEYLNVRPKPVKALLSRIRAIIKEVAHDATEVISYRMPAYKYHGMLIGFAAHTNHCSLYLWKKDSIDQFKEELSDYSISAGTIRFTVEKPISDKLVRKIVKYRMKENLEKIKRKS